jgi:transposase
MLSPTNSENILAKEEALYSVSLSEHEAALQKIKALEHKNAELESTVAQLKEQEDKKIAELESTVAQLKEQIALMQHQRFGKKSEVSTGEPKIKPEDANAKKTAVSGYTRKKGTKKRGRNLDTSELLRHRIVHDLDEKDKVCSCCHSPLKQIGKDTSEQIEVIPAQLYVVEHIWYKYSCSTCNTLTMPSKPKAPLPKAMAGGSLIADVVINKYQYHLPLYRQSKIMSSYGANIPDNTLGNWLLQSGEGLIPLYEALWAAVLKSHYLQVDESPVLILKPNKKGYLWTYFSPHLGKGLVFFELSLTRSSTVPEERLQYFTGLMQTDGYAGYNKLRKRTGIVGLGCFTHCRRKFDEVLKISKNPDGVAAEFMERIKPLYILEAKMRELKLNFHSRKRLRQKKSLPIIKSLYKWLQQKREC